jgi:hypothetical protein
MAGVSEAADDPDDFPHGTSQLASDLTDDQLDAALLLASLDALLMEELSRDEDNAFAVALTA